MTRARPAVAAPTLDELRDRAAGLFTRTFGAEPARAAQAPGRVNLIGEHTDYNLGHVLPLAIDRWCVVAGAIADGEHTTVVSDHTPGALASAELTSLRPGDLPEHGWTRYALGTLATLAQRDPRTLPALNVAITTSVPLGAGLSSSAAIEVALLTLAADLWGISLDPLQAALLAQRAEHTFPGVPCGLMDQLAAASGVSGHALLIDCRESTLRPVMIPADAAIVVTDSGVKHAHAGGGYAARRASCARVVEALGIDALADATPWALRRFAAEIDPADLACAQHVVSENARTLQCAAALGAGDLVLAGQLMLASHDSLRRDFDVSCPEIDTLVNAAMDLGGVHGSRLTGGGFGGCTVTLCRPDAVEPLSSHLAAASREKHAKECHSFAVRACPGAGMLSV